MAMITYPLNGIDYSAADAGLFHCTRKSGVWAKDSFSVRAAGSSSFVTVLGGVAWISNDKYWGKVVAQKENVTIDLGIADAVYNRIDVIVIQFDSNKNGTELVIKKGTPASKPVAPEIVQTESLFELCLCKVLRPAGSSVITSGNITDTRMDETVCGLMADSVTRIDTSAINSQVQALITSLMQQIEDVKSRADVLLKSTAYPVGSVFMTSTNESPSTYLGGKWALIDKNFVPWQITDSKLFTPTKHVKSHEVNMTRTGKTLSVRINITTASEMGDSGAILGNLNLEKMGISRIAHTMYGQVIGQDLNDFIITTTLSYDSGKIEVTDVWRKNPSISTVPAEVTFYVELNLPIYFEHMLDEGCNQFMWKKVGNV